MSAALPSGTVTFLVTDIEGSTRLWQDHPDAMRSALARHDEILRGAAARHDGWVFETAGDAFRIAFPSVTSALLAALSAQRTLAAEPWPTPVSLSVRMAIDSASAMPTAGRYDEASLAGADALLPAGHGGQVLVSEAAKALVASELPSGAGLRDLGVHVLGDEAGGHEARIHQLTAEGLRRDHPPLRVASRRPGNVRELPSAFVGRQRELAELGAMLASAGLITLTGLGGCGKTRLAIRLAVQQAPGFQDGAWLVELADLAEADAVAGHVAGVFGLREERGRAIADTLVGWLSERQLLLVLDNCEHLLDAVPVIADAILRAAPGVRIIATSREALGIRGEAIYGLRPLETPSADDAACEATALAGVESVQLFLARASELDSDLPLDDASAGSVAEIVRRLEGIPLAIELAVAWTELLSLAEIADRLDERFLRMAGGQRLAQPRQQTLEAALDWSDALLRPSERRLFHALSVFRGGWSLEAAEAVTSGVGLDPGEVLDLLARLVRQSLVVVDARREAMRYRLYETVRQYALRRARERGDEGAARGAHLRYFLELAEGAEPELKGPRQASAMRALEGELENLRAAVDHAIATDQGEAGLRMGGALWYFWWIRGHEQEAVTQLEAVLALPSAQSPTRVRAIALFGAGSLLWPVGLFERARERFEASLAIFRALGDEKGIAGALNGLGIVANRRGDVERSRGLFEESLRLRRACGDEEGVAMLLGNLGVVTQDLGDFEAAHRYYVESLERAEAQGDLRAIALATDNLGTVELELGRPEAAIERHERSLALRREIGDKEGVGLSLCNLGVAAMISGDLEAAAGWLAESLDVRRALDDRYMLAASVEMSGLLASAAGEHARAARLLGASEALTASLGVAAMGASDRRRHQEALDRAASALGSKAQEEAHEAGRRLGLDGALALASEALRG